MKTQTHARIILAALSAFAAAAVAGMAFATLGPIAVIRWLGLVATLGAVTGCALQLMLLQESDPAALPSLRGRLHALRARLAGSVLAALSRVRPSRTMASVLANERLSAGA